LGATDSSRLRIANLALPASLRPRQRASHAFAHQLAQDHKAPPRPPRSRHHPARRLSGGEQQKLAIARAWATNPAVLLLDEPTASLDPKATKDVEGHIADLRREGVTIVMSTHDIAQAKRLADRILFLHDGRLLEDATASLFFNGPSTTAARHFLEGVLE
jgi:ABC-type phosphate transport system ATPase subunit